MSFMFLLLAIKLRKLHCSNKGESGISVNYTSYRKKHPTYAPHQRLSNKKVKKEMVINNQTCSMLVWFSALVLSVYGVKIINIEILVRRPSTLEGVNQLIHS